LFVLVCFVAYWWRTYFDRVSLLTGILRITFRCCTEQCLLVVLLSDSVFCSFSLFMCFLFVGAGFDSPVTFDVLVAPPFKEDRCV